VANEFFSSFGGDAAVSLTPGANGRFEVYMDGEKIFDRKEEGNIYPDLGRIRKMKQGKTIMGEVDTAPEVAAKVIEDLTELEVDPDKCERLYKAALVQSNSGVTYRMLAKVLTTGKVDLVHYGCDLDADGKPTTKWKIRRILEQAPERFDKELEAIKKGVTDDGEVVQGAWVHDMTGIPDVAAQGKSLVEWSRNMTAEVRKKPS